MLNAHEIIPGTKVVRVKPGFDNWLRSQLYPQDWPKYSKLDGEIVRALPLYSLEEGKATFGDDWELEPDDGSRLCCDKSGCALRIPGQFLEDVEAL